MKDALILQRYTENVIHAERLRVKVEELKTLPDTISAKGLEGMAANVLALLTGLPEEGEVTNEELRGFLRGILKGIKVDGVMPSTR